MSIAARHVERAPVVSDSRRVRHMRSREDDPSRRMNPATTGMWPRCLSARIIAFVSHAAPSPNIARDHWKMRPGPDDQCAFRPDELNLACGDQALP